MKKEISFPHDNYVTEWRGGRVWKEREQNKFQTSLKSGYSYVNHAPLPHSLPPFKKL